MRMAKKNLDYDIGAAFEALENELSLNVYVDNDVRAMALGESWFGITKNIGNFVTLNISNAELT